jgi:predicted ester cyclase
MVVSGDIVMTELTWTATHTGPFFGIPATGETVLHNGIVVRRLEEGKIVESWEIWDDLAFFNSIGLSPSWDDLLAQAAE